MANIITSCRILCSILLLFVPAFSPIFYILYLVAGFTDMIDGTIARKTNTASEFGSRLDTSADIVLFIFPLTLTIVDLKYSGVFICTIAILAAVQEGILIRTENHNRRVREICGDGLSHLSLLKFIVRERCHYGFVGERLSKFILN